MFNKKRAAAAISLVLVSTLVCSFLLFYKVNQDESIAKNGGMGITDEVEKNNTIEGAIVDRYGNHILYTEEVGVAAKASHPEAYSYLVGINSKKYGINGLRNRYYKYLYKRQKNSERGATIQLTLDSNLQEYTYNLLGNNVGSITVLNAQTGEILAMAARGDQSVGFDINQVIVDDAKKDVNTDVIPKYSKIDDFWYNRATFSQDPPGSTFKVITAASLIENDMEDYEYNDMGIYSVGGNSITNQNKAAYGTSNLEEALNVSNNVYFASAGVALGNQKLQATAERFGFNDTIELDFDTLHSNYSVKGDTDIKGIASNAYGQGELQASPLQMAMCIQAVMNDGTMLKPYLVKNISREDGKVLEKAKQKTVLYKSIDVKTAKKLKKLLHTNANHDLYKMGDNNGYYAIAKTGTAETHEGKIHKYLIAAIETKNGQQFAICMDFANLNSSDVEIKAPMRTLLEYLSVSQVTEE